MLRLKCLKCGLTVPYKGSAGNLCPRCLVREQQAVELITVSDRPSKVSGRSSGRLRIATRAREGRCAVNLSGELDVASAQVLEQTLADICDAGATEVVLDLGGIEFMDSTGLNAILRGRRLCEDHRCELFLLPAQRPVERVFEVSGLRQRLPFRRQASRGSQ